VPTSPRHSGAPMPPPPTSTGMAPSTAAISAGGRWPAEPRRPDPSTPRPGASMANNQFELLQQRRFLPYFLVQALGAFNDNVYRQAIIGLLFFMGVSPEQRTLYTNLAPALFILPYFLFSGLAGQIAERLEKQKLIRITT